MPNCDKSSLNNSALDRRNILLGGTTLAAASAIVANNPVQMAQAQTQPRHLVQRTDPVALGDQADIAQRSCIDRT
jgi:hypothetical protein